MTRRILTIAAAAGLLLTAAAAPAKRNDTRPAKPRKSDPAACTQMDLAVTQFEDGSYLITVDVAEACRGDLYADLSIEVDGQPVADATVEGVSEFSQEAELGPQPGSFEVCAELYGQMKDRKKSKTIDHKECALIEPGGADA